MHTTRLSEAQPLWGILPPNTAAIPPSLANNLTTTRLPSLRLPGILTSTTSLLLTSNDYNPSRLGQYLPAVDFYGQALQNAFTIRRPGSVGYEGYADYSGMTGLALYKKWQALSKSAEGAAEIVKLVWTDIAANSVVGTRGWGLDGSPEGADGGVGAVRKKRDANGDDAVVLVTVYRRRVRYRLPYMAPAVVVLALAVGVLGTWLVLLVMGRTGPAKMRRFLDATSPGRILGGFLWPGKAATVGRTDEWVKTVGTRVVVVGSGSGEAVAVAGMEGHGTQDGDGEVRVDGEESIQLMPVEKDKPVSTTW
jgi:hypothetical protein